MKSSITIYATLLCVAALSSTAYCARRYTTSATGTVKCRMADGTIQPLKQVVVKLLDKDTLVDDTFGQTRSGTNGAFSVSGSARDLFGKPDPLIQVVYDYRGTYGHMEVEGLLGITRKYKTPKRNYARNINFGTIVISDDHCRAYVRFYDALRNYYIRTGTTVPYSTLQVRTHVILHGGTPYALRSTVKIPRGYNVTPRTAQHELGHTIRHTLDGNGAHFLFDVVRFGYLRHHTCSSKTNAGYAFNEGWAEFWANDCTRSSYGSSSTDYTIEGNVANALRKLKSSCGLSDSKMVNVLKNNRGKIHSYNDFLKYSGC